MEINMHDQNRIRNQKLEMSIRPFSILRQDLKKSKSVDKTRKGISRVNNLDRNASVQKQVNLNTHLPLSYNFSTAERNEVQNINQRRDSISIEAEIHNKVLQKQMFIKSGNNWNANQLNLANFRMQQNSEKQGQYRTDNFARANQFELNSKYKNVNEIKNNQNQMEFDLNCRIQMLQKQLIVMQRQNEQLMKQNQQYKTESQKLKTLYNQTIIEIKRYKQDVYVNKQQKNKNIQIQRIQQQLIHVRNTIFDKQEQMRLKDKHILQLVQINKCNSGKINQCNEEIHRLTIQLEKQMNIVIDLQDKIKINSNNSNNMIKLQQALRQSQYHTTQLQQQYRVILVKNANLMSQKSIAQQKYIQAAQQLEAVKRENSRLIESCQILQQQTIFARACRKQIQQMEDYRKINQGLRQKIKQLQIRRINQIQFHQQQIRRMQYKNTSKTKDQYEQHQKYVAQLSQLKLENKINIQQLAKQFQIQKQHIIDNISEQYKRIIIQMEQKLASAGKQYQKAIYQQNIKIQEYEKQHQYVIQRKQRQMQDLVKKLNQIKQDNNFLMTKLSEQRSKLDQKENLLQAQIRCKQKYMMEITNKQNLQKYKSRSPTKMNYGLDHEPVLGQKRLQQNNKNESMQNASALQTQITFLQAQNDKIMYKLTNFEKQYIKIQQKIRVSHIQIQKYKNKQQSYERKIKHLIQQIQYITKQKQKSIPQKVKIIEQMQAIKQFSILKQAEALKTAKEYKNKQQEYQRCIQQLKHQIVLTTSQLQSTKQQLIDKQSRILVIESTLKQKQIQYQNIKHEQLRRLQKQTHMLAQEKQAIKQYIVGKQQQNELRYKQQLQNRLSLYKQYFAILQPAKTEYFQCLDDNDEQEMIRKMIKLMRNCSEDYRVLDQKQQKLQKQYKQLIQIENGTRALAHKYQDKCLQLQVLLVKMQQIHKQKLVLIKNDYDVLYSKYLKYRNMVIGHNKFKNKQFIQPNQFKTISAIEKMIQNKTKQRQKALKK